jgi:hypothetical protein
MDNSQEIDLDKIIERLIDSKGKEVKLSETEIRALCVKSR